MKKIINIIITMFIFWFITNNSTWYYNDYSNEEGQNKYYKMLIEEKNKKVKLLEENIEKVLEDYKKLDTNDLKSFNLNKIENIFNDFKRLLDEDIIVKDRYKYNLEQLEKALNKKRDFDWYQEYLKNWDKYNLTNVKDWKDFMDSFKELKENKSKIKKQFESAKNSIKRWEVYAWINSYKNTCIKIKLFECDYEISKYYKQEMIWYSETYHTSNKRENFEKNKKEAIKYLENAIYNYKKDLYLEEISILEIEKELQEIKNYEFKWDNKKSNIVKEEIKNEQSLEESKLVKLFFQRLNNLTKNYSENRKKELYKLLIVKLNEFKNKSSKIELNKDIDKIILRLKQI